MATLLLFCAILLSGCASEREYFRPQIKIEENSEKVCKDYPAPPTGDYMQSDVALYAIDAKDAYLDCRAKAEALSKLIRDK